MKRAAQTLLVLSLVTAVHVVVLATHETRSSLGDPCERLQMLKLPDTEIAYTQRVAAGTA